MLNQNDKLHFSLVASQLAFALRSTTKPHTHNHIGTLRVIATAHLSNLLPPTVQLQLRSLTLRRFCLPVGGCESKDNADRDRGVVFYECRMTHDDKILLFLKYRRDTSEEMKQDINDAEEKKVYKSKVILWATFNWLCVDSVADSVQLENEDDYPTWMVRR